MEKKLLFFKRISAFFFLFLHRKGTGVGYLLGEAVLYGDRVNYSVNHGSFDWGSPLVQLSHSNLSIIAVTLLVVLYLFFTSLYTDLCSSPCESRCAFPLGSDQRLVAFLVSFIFAGQEKLGFPVLLNNLRRQRRKQV